MQRAGYSQLVIDPNGERGFLELMLHREFQGCGGHNHSLRLGLPG